MSHSVFFFSVALFHGDASIALVSSGVVSSVWRCACDSSRGGRFIQSVTSLRLRIVMRLYTCTRMCIRRI